MPDDREAILRYLLPARGTFWRWDDAGRGLAWAAGGHTIAFREEVLAVLRRLADSSTALPPFAAIVLLLAATRDTWPAVAPRVVAHADELATTGGGDTSSAVGVTLRAIGHRLASDAAALDAVAALPPDLRRSPAAKATLAEVVFELAGPQAQPAAANVLAELESGTDPATAVLRSPPAALRQWVDAVDALRPGLDGLSADRLSMRARTGLDAKVRPAQVELTPSERARALLAELADDAPDLAAVARLARGLLAAVAVPRPIGAPDDRPAGGVADLSNRGPLDRLLLSELAHDDLTLAVRVAVNEALYLQRETPPRQPPRRRAILIDTGLRTWGVPRVYATAVALALTATADGNAAAYRPAAVGIAPADLTTRAGLVDHLAALDGRAHLGDALPTFAAATADAATERFLITTDDALADPDFQRAHREHGPPAAYAAVVSRDGSFRLWHLSPAGRRLVRSAKLDLNALLEPPRKAARPPAPLVKSTGDLPTILSIAPFPLWLPPTSPIRAVSGDAFAITRDRRLLGISTPGAAPVQISDRVPYGRVRHLSHGDDHVQAIVFRSRRSGGSRCAGLYSEDESAVQVTPIEVDFDPIEVVERDGTLYLIGKRVAAVIDPRQSQPLAILDTSGCRHVRGRHYVAGHLCKRLTYDGTRLYLTTPGAASLAQHIFEWAGHPELLQIGPQGEVTTDGSAPEVVRPGHGRSRLAHYISADGSRLVAWGGSASNEHRRLDLTAGDKWSAHKGSFPHSWLEQVRDGPFRPVGLPSLRTRFGGVFVDPDGTLGLVARGQFGLRAHERGDNLWLDCAYGANRASAPADVHPFVPTSAPAGVGYRLRVASWRDGSRAFLDSRGLLHLKPADRTLPEVALVLTSAGPVAAWSSDGHLYGPKPFHGEPAVAGGRHLDALIRRFTGPLR